MTKFGVLLIAGAALAILASAPGHAHAQVLASDTTVSGPANSGYYGQAVTTAAGTGPYDDITFSWLDGGAPVAGGNLYIFTSAYTGAASGLASASFYAESSGVSGGVWDFASSLLLSANTTYYFYSDSPSLVITYDTSDGASGGYFGSEGFTLQDGLSQDFVLTGAPFAVPEPKTIALLVSGLIALAAGYRRRALTH